MDGNDVRKITTKLTVKTVLNVELDEYLGYGKNHESCSKVAGWIIPTLGDAFPVTVAMLMRNTVMFERKKNVTSINFQDIFKSNFYSSLFVLNVD